MNRGTNVARALRAEAERLGIDPKRATRGELARIARALPRALYDEITATARANGWEPDEFLAVFVAPLLGRALDAS